MVEGGGASDFTHAATAGRDRPSRYNQRPTAMLDEVAVPFIRVQARAPQPEE
jgi:hypothetical protein